MLKKVATFDKVVVAYDNINFKDDVRDQALGSKGRMRNLTTALLIKCPELPDGGLKQTMHDPSVPLDADALIEKVGSARDAYKKQVAEYFIVEALAKLHGDAVANVWEQEHMKPSSERIARPTFPMNRRLDPTPTDFYQCGAIYEDEGTIDGTYGVHDRIWGTYCGCSTSPGDGHFRERLWLAYGDQKTAHHIRTVKREQQMSESDYERKRWLLGPIGWFHVMQSFLNMIVRAHWDTPLGKAPQSTLKYDYLLWQRAGISRDNTPFYLVDPLVMQSWTARIVALWYRLLEEEGLVKPPALWGQALDAEDTAWKEERSVWDEAIGSLSAADALRIAQKIQDVVFTYESWSSESNGIEWRSACRYLRAGLTYHELKFAVKLGDVGILRRLIDELAVWFFGTDQFQYGYEMLHMAWLLSDSVSTPELQHAILAGSLVNIPGRPGFFKATDLCVEHVNYNCKIDMKMHKNSTHNVDITFGRRALVSRYAAQQRGYIERLFRRRDDQLHKQKNVERDLFSLARRSAVDGPRPRPGSACGDAFNADDILQRGMASLEEKVGKFNEDHVEGVGKLRRSLYPGCGQPPSSEDYVEITDVALDVDNDTALGFECDAPAYRREFLDEGGAEAPDSTQRVVSGGASGGSIVADARECNDDDPDVDPDFEAELARRW